MSTSFLPLLNDKDKDNQFYLLIKGTTLYRADDNKIHTSSYKPRFFGISQKGVQSYGKIVYKFTTKKDLKLLAIDKNIINGVGKGIFDAHNVAHYHRSMDVYSGHIRQCLKHS